MKNLTAFLFACMLASAACAQTVKTLAYNTTNGRVVYSGTNDLKFTNSVGFGDGDLKITQSGAIEWAGAVKYEPETQTFFAALEFSSTNVSAATRTNLGLGWSALANSTAATSLLGLNNNGQVVYNNTDTLTFTSRIYQSSTNATNVPELRLTTKSNNVASWFVYDAVQTNPPATNWSVLFLGLNTQPNGTGTDRGLVNQSIGAASFTIENMWMSPVPDPDAPLAEFYFNITDTSNLTTRGFSVIGNQTNSTLGFASFTYPLVITYDANSRYWYGGDMVGLNVVSTNTGELATFTHSTTNPSGTAQIYLKVQNNQTIWQAGRNSTYLRNFGAGRNAFRVETNGVIYGAVGSGDLPLSPIHLAGNTRIDGAISFNVTSNAAITRTNLGLPLAALTNTSNVTLMQALSGSTNTNHPFSGSVSVVGTNNTNTLVFSNGILQEVQ